MLLTANAQANANELVTSKAVTSQNHNLDMSGASACRDSEQRISDEIAKLLNTFKMPRKLHTTEAKTSTFISDCRPLPPPVRFAKKYKAL